MLDKHTHPPISKKLLEKLMPSLLRSAKARYKLLLVNEMKEKGTGE